MWTAEERLEHYCRMGLLAVAILHWIVFALLVSSDTSAAANDTSAPMGNLAASILDALFRI